MSMSSLATTDAGAPSVKPCSPPIRVFMNPTIASKQPAAPGVAEHATGWKPMSCCQTAFGPVFDQRSYAGALTSSRGRVSHVKELAATG